MSYAYRARKKAIKKLKRVHKKELDRNQLPPELMPKNPYLPDFLGSFEILVMEPSA